MARVYRSRYSGISPINIPNFGKQKVIRRARLGKGVVEVHQDPFAFAAQELRKELA